MTRPKRKILQVIPAEGWFAVYKENDGSESSVRLACWALVEETDDEFTDNVVVGMETGYDQSVDFADTAVNFVRYVHTSDQTEEKRKV